ncbi:MAG TPA: DUF1573 domain-containing protein [Ferruginibacter sp.]|nr:DUF1573 domain-containing protein [Ferruginibacter sp.]
MRKIFTFFGFLFCLSSMQAQQISKSNGATDVQAKTVVATSNITIAQADALLSLKETEYNFGKIPQGKPVTHIFEVVNNSNLPLKINNIHASCGCTTPEWEKDKTVAPGEKTQIKVGYNAAAEGPFNKFITVSYNDSQTKQITIKGEVWKTPGTAAPENKGVNDLKN